MHGEDPITLNIEKCREKILRDFENGFFERVACEVVYRDRAYVREYIFDQGVMRVN